MTGASTGVDESPPKAVVFFDCDGTLTPSHGSWRTVHELLGTVDHQEEHHGLYRNGEITFEEWSEITVDKWAPIPTSELHEEFEKTEPISGIAETVDAIHDIGMTTGILSAGLRAYVDRVAKLADFDFVVSNELVVEDGHLTGDVKIKVTEESKKDWYERIAAEYSVRPSKTVVIGDAEHDLQKIHPAALSIAFNPATKEARNAADIVIESDNLRDVVPVIRGWHKSN